MEQRILFLGKGHNTVHASGEDRTINPSYATTEPLSSNVAKVNCQILRKETKSRYKQDSYKIVNP